MAAIPMERGPAGSTAYGAACVTGASFTFGAWVELIASTAFNADMVWVTGWTLNVTEAFAAMNIEIGLGAAGSEVVKIPGTTMLSGVVSGADKPFGQTIPYPIFIPSGSRVSARIRSGSSSGTRTGHVSVHLLATGAPSYDTAFNLGAVAVDPGATANTKGAWVQLSASLPSEINYLSVRANTFDATAVAGSWRLDLGTGAAASEVVAVPDLFLGLSGLFDPLTPCYHYEFPLGESWAAGTRVVARLMCSHATAGDRALDIGAVGLHTPHV